MNLQSILYKTFSLKPNELKLLLYATLFILLLFASYAILRPIRDALGIHNSTEVLKWLFLGTFLATLVGSFVAMFLSGAIKRRFYIDAIFYFFALNLLGFYIAMCAFDESSKGFMYLSYTFYIWVSVFNLFVISSAWSLLVDIFSKDSSKRLFGIIAAGASIGSILGSFGVSVLSNLSMQVSDFLLISIVLLCLAIVIKYLLIKESYKLLDSKEKQMRFQARFANAIGSKNPLSGISIILKSRYLLAFVGFILLLTSVSTFLYMEQARIIKELFPTKESRIAAFANIDFIVQTLSFIIQIFFTAKIAESFGLKWLLSLLGFVIGFGFIVLSFTHPLFLPFIIVMCIRRVGEYALVKPGREMLFVSLDSDSKYKVKNFLDTVVYRAGDAISAQVESVLLKFGVSVVLLSGAVISFIWGFLGLYLAKGYEKDSIKST